MSESMVCPYCESKVRMSDVDDNDGTCPECGAPLLGSTLFSPPEDEDFEGDEEGFFMDDEEEEDDMDFLSGKKAKLDNDDFFGEE